MLNEERLACCLGKAKGGDIKGNERSEITSLRRGERSKKKTKERRRQKNTKKAEAVNTKGDRIRNAGQKTKKRKKTTQKKKSAIRQKRSSEARPTVKDLIRLKAQGDMNHQKRIV